MTRRGLTMIEVLAAAALLATTVGALAPLLRDARDVGQIDQSSSGVFELSRAADVLMQGIGPEEIETLSSAEHSVSWPGDAGRAPIIVRASLHGDPDDRHAWIVFEHDGLMVARWVRMQEVQP